MLLLIAIGAVARSGRRALLAPAAAGVLLPLGTAWLDGRLPGLAAAPDGPRIWLLATATIALAATGLLLPRADVDRRPAAGHTAVAWGGRGLR